MKPMPQQTHWRPLLASAFAACMALGAATGGNKLAAQTLPDARTQTYFNSEPYRQLISVLGMDYDEKMHERKPQCQTGYKWEPISFVLLQPLTFQEGTEHPQTGVWTYRFKFEQCGESVVYNALLQGQAGKQPRSVPLVPGLTRANLRLMNDLMMPLAMSAVMAGMPSDCKNVKVLDTQVTAEPFALKVDGQVFPGAWQELWKARACGKDFSTEICLVPQPQGGTNWTLGSCRR